MLSRLLIIPNVLHDAINQAINKALAGRPCDEHSREQVYQSVLAYYDDHGTIPDFELKEKTDGSSNGN